MSIEVLGLSGSPIKNSDTDRLVQAVLDATGLETEFVKCVRVEDQLNAPSRGRTVDLQLYGRSLKSG